MFQYNINVIVNFDSMVLSNHLSLVKMVSLSLLLYLNKPPLRKQSENRKMSCPSTLTNGMLMPPLKGETVKKNSHNREFSYVLLFYWVFYIFDGVFKQLLCHNL